MKLRVYSLTFFIPYLVTYSQVGQGLYDIFPRNIPKNLDKPPEPSRIDRFLGVEERIPPEKVITKEGWILPQGKDPLAIKNKGAVDMITKAGKGEKIESFKKAKEIFLKSREKNPQFFAIRFNLGRIFLALNQHQDAIQEFRMASLLVPNYSENFHFLGKAYQLAGDKDEAMQYFRIAFRKNPFNVSSLISLASLLTQEKRYTRAIQVLRYCISINRESNNALIGFGKIAFFLEDYYDAMLWFKKVETDRSFDKEMHFFFAESAFFAQDYQTSIEQYEIMLKDPETEIFGKASYKWIESRRDQARRLLTSQED